MAKPLDALRLLFALTVSMAVLIQPCFAAKETEETSGEEDPSAVFVALNEWEAGYCGELRVRSKHQQVRDWQVVVTVRGPITTVGNGSYSKGKQGKGIFEPANWNNVIPVGGESVLVICGSGDYPEIHEVRLARR